MRMPILSYFLVAGIFLFGGLVLVSSEFESKPLPVSKRLGCRLLSKRRKKKILNHQRTITMI